MKSRQITRLVTLSHLLHEYESLDDAYSEVRNKKLNLIRRQTLGMSADDVVMCIYRVGRVRTELVKVEKADRQ
jgi:hypothetical protein